MKSCCCAVCGNGVSFVSWERVQPCSCGAHRAHTAVSERASASAGTQRHVNWEQLAFQQVFKKCSAASLEVKLVYNGCG